MIFTRLFPPGSVVACALLSVCVLTGCAVGPDYDPPEFNGQDNWNDAVLNEMSTNAPMLERWWEVFDDDTLTSLITKAGTNSLDARIAFSRVQEAAQGLSISRGERWPTVNGQGSAQATQISENTNPSLPEGAETDGEFFQLGLSASWELDVWGRVRRTTEAAEANYAASLEDYRDALVVLYSSLASAYVDVRTLQQRIEYAEKNIKLQTETLGLTTNRYKLGISSYLDVRQAELNLSVTTALVPGLRAQLSSALNQVGVLAGDDHTSVWPMLLKDATLPSPPKEVAVGVPVNVLRQRPDVRAAERRLAAQTARIGAAKAQLYPTFTLPGSFTMESLEGGSLFESTSVAYSFGPSFRWGLFAGGALRAAVDLEEARTETAYLAYRKTILSAVADIETAMSAFNEERDRLAALRKGVEAGRDSVELVKTLYKSGLTDFQNVLDMERTLTQQEDQLASSEGALARNAISLYRALGGGWQTLAPDEDVSQEKDDE